MSALDNCSRGLNVVIKWGTRLEMRGKEKNERRNAALNICPIYTKLH